MERSVDLGDGTRLWAEAVGPDEGTAFLLVMGANASSVTWPDELVDRLAEQHRVIRYDHRDTGRSSWTYDERPYALRDLATDAVAVLDAFAVDRAHAVGMSLGGVLVQLLVADHPERLRSATVFGTGPIGSLAAVGDVGPEPDLPGPDPELLAFWETMGDERDAEAELAWRVEHWRLLNGRVLPFDADLWRDLEQRSIDHAGRFDTGTAHARADQSGLDRPDAMATTTVPVLVVDAPEDPITPPPHAEVVARTIRGADRVTIPGMGHAIHPMVIAPLADAILRHAARAERP